MFHVYLPGCTPGFCLLGARASHCENVKHDGKPITAHEPKNHHPLDIQGTIEYNWDQHSTERTYIQHCFWKYSSSCYRYLLIDCSAPMPTSKYVFLKCFGLHHLAILCFSPNHSNTVLESTPAHASWYLRSRRSSLTWITSSSNKTHQVFFTIPWNQLCLRTAVYDDKTLKISTTLMVLLLQPAKYNTKIRVEKQS